MASTEKENLITLWKLKEDSLGGMRGAFFSFGWILMCSFSVRSHVAGVSRLSTISQDCTVTESVRTSRSIFF